MGIAIGKAIGVYYATKRPVICFIGDQGFQYNSQELQYISQWKLPICIVILNNQTSAMIKDKEIQKYGKVIHTTKESGYSTPDFKMLASAYDVDYYRSFDGDIRLTNELKPSLVNVILDDHEQLLPCLPYGNPIQDLSPELERKRYLFLNNL